MLQRTLERGHLKAGWVAGDDAFGMSPSFRDGLAALGMRYVLDVPAGATVWPPEPAWTSPDYQRSGRPHKPKLVDGQRRTIVERSDALPDGAWREIKVAEGSQGPRTYRFSAQRVRVTRSLGRLPPELAGEPRYYLNAPEDTPLETLAHVGGSRCIETDSGRRATGTYETRGAGNMVMCRAEPFC